MKHSQLTQHLQSIQYQSFTQFLNEFEIEGEVQQGKPLWNGEDYLDENGDIDLTHRELSELPCIFPKKWDRSFYCGNNQLISLHDSPREIGGDFYCNNNKLTSLEGAPIIVEGGFNCSYNELTSLEGAPQKVGGGFGCWGNPVQFTKEEVRQISQVGKIYMYKMKNLKSFSQFLNEFELEGEHQKQIYGISPFSNNDIQKVNQIIQDYWDSSLIKKFDKYIQILKDDLKNNPQKYNDDVIIDFTYISTAAKDISFWIKGLDHIISKHPHDNNYVIYEGSSLLFTDSEQGNDIFNNKFWESSLIMFNYGILDEELSEYNKYNIIIDDSKILKGLDGAVVIHSVNEFKNLMTDIEKEVKNKYPDLIKMIDNFIKNYCLRK